MNLIYETILDFYTFKERKILCHIKVNRKSQKFKDTCRSLSQEQWATFDKKLEKLLTANDIDERGTKFKLNPFIVVKVQKSKLRMKHYIKLLEKIYEFKEKYAFDFKEEPIVLECLIEFQQEVSSSASTEKPEYKPKINMSPIAKECSSTSYEPYIPTMKRLREENIDIIKNKEIESNEDIYSPKPLVGICLTDPHFPPEIPQYTPAPINDRRKSKDINKLNFAKEKDNEVNSSARQKTLKISSNKKYKKMECEYIPESQDISTLNVPVYIPTPIEATRDYVRKNRKRSNTIDVFTDLTDENDEEKLKPSSNQQSYIENLKHQSHNKSLKKRSMTIDEIPTELSDMPVYIPTPLNECVFQNVFKTCDMKNEKDLHSLKDVKTNKNAKENLICEKSDPNGIGSLKTKNAGKSLSDNFNPKTFLSTGDIFKFENAFISQETPAALDNFNIFPKSQDTNEITNGAEKNLQNIYDIDNLVRKPLSTESKTINKNIIIGQPEVLEKGQSYDKHIEDKRYRNSISVSDKKYFKTSSIESKSAEAAQTYMPKSLSEGQKHSANKISGKNKASLKNKDLFGTDDEDDDETPFKNNKIKKILKACDNSTRKCTNKSSLSKKKTHKKDKSSKIEEKKDIKCI